MNSERLREIKRINYYPELFSDDPSDGFIEFIGKKQVKEHIDKLKENNDMLECVTIVVTG